MSTPFTFNGTLSFPADPGGSPTPISINFANQFNQIIAETLQLSGSGTKVLDLSPLNGGAGASLVLIKVDPQVAGTPAVSVRWNTGTALGQQELQPGGFLVIGDPSPSAGLITLSILFTGIGLVRVWALG
jgi:hypothetical protein